jgi:hypothetical protein
VPRDGVEEDFVKEVTWIETAGVETEPLRAFLIATVEGNTLYVASSFERIGVLAGLSILPKFEKSSVGDQITSPVPNFFGKPVTYLGIFQDRLIVGSNSVLSISRPGDYLNFFRRSVLTIPSDDPLEIFSLGSEDDTLVSSAVYDQNLVIFGKRRQYAIPGRQPISPQTPIITVLSSYEDAVESNVMSLGNLIFYTQFRNGYGSLHQLQPGEISETVDSVNISQTLSRYIVGKPHQIIGGTSPNNIFMRTIGNPYGLYIYNYLDERQRVYDSWSRWEWDTRMGPSMGMTLDKGNLTVFTVRRGKNITDDFRWWICAERFSLDVDIDTKPYFDSNRKYTYYRDNPLSSLNDNSDEINVNCAFDSTVRHRFLGSPIQQATILLIQYPGEENLNALWCGYPFKAQVIPTNPYIKDNDGNAIETGTMVITNYNVNLADTGGIKAYISTRSRGQLEATEWQGVVEIGDWNGREIGQLAAELGIQPIASGNVKVGAGYEIRDFKYYLESRTWLPINITSIEWTGQFYYRTRRG